MYLMYYNHTHYHCNINNMSTREFAAQQPSVYLPIMFVNNIKIPSYIICLVATEYRLNDETSGGHGSRVHRRRIIIASSTVATGQKSISIGIFLQRQIVTKKKSR